LNLTIFSFWVLTKFVKYVNIMQMEISTSIW